jgi:uncharacterized protein
MSRPPRSRTRVRRQPSRGRYERADVDAVLDGGLFCHVAFVDDGQPYCVPMLHARAGDRVLVHGSSASRAMRILAVGADACLTVTTLRGLVLARSAFEHSANYDAVMVLGRFTELVEEQERMAAFEAFTDRLVPGRFAEVRPPSRKELKATMILALELAEASVKTRSGPPSDDDSEDAARETWAGVVPLHTVLGAPEPSPGLRAGIPTDASVERLVAAWS